MQKNENRFKRLRKILLRIFGIALLLLLLLTFVLQTSYVQTKLTQYFTKKFSQQLNTDISIDNVKLSLFKGLLISGLYVEDQAKDTLLYIGEMSVIPRNFRFFNNRIKFKRVNIDSLTFNYYEISDTRNNLDFILDSFASDSEEDSTSSDFRLSCFVFNIKNSHIKYKTFNPPTIDGMNYDDMDFTNVNISLSEIYVRNSNISASIDSISLQDKCGVSLDKLSIQNFLFTTDSISAQRLRLVTGESDFKLKNLTFKYDNFGAFKHFVKEMQIDADFDSSGVLVFNDLRHLAPEFNGIGEKIKFEGKAHGTVANLFTENLNVWSGNLFRMNITSHIENLPKTDNLKFDIIIGNLYSDIKEIKKLQMPGDTVPFLDLPAELENISDINYSGRTVGSLYNFVSNGRLKSNLGNIAVDVNASRDSISIIKVNGKFKGENLNIANVFNNPQLGQLTFNQVINLSYLKSGKIQLRTEGVIDSVVYNGYKYRNVKLFANMYDDNFDSLSIKINQPEIKAEFFGKINLTPEKPEVKFSFKLDSANLKKLNLDKNVNKSLLSFNIEADFRGLSADDFEGKIRVIDYFKYETDSINLKLKKFNVVARNDYQNGKEIKNIQVFSDLLDMELVNTGKFANIDTKFQNVLNKYFPILFEKALETKAVQYSNLEYIKIKAKIKNPEIATMIFIPEIELAKNSNFDFYYNYFNDSLNLTLTTKKFSYTDIEIVDFYTVIYSMNDSLFSSTGGSSVNYTTDYTLKNFDITTSVLSDSLNFDLSWNNFSDTALYSGNIIGRFNPAKHQNKFIYNAEIEKSKFIISDTVWNISPSKIKIDSTTIEIQNFTITNKIQKIYIDGIVSENEGDFLYVFFDKFDISNLNILAGESLNLKGKLSGTTKLVQLYANPFIISHDSIISLEVNNVALGNLYMKSSWDNNDQRIIAELFNKKTNTRGQEFVKDSIVGSYWPAKDSLSFNIRLNEFLVKTFDQYYDEYIEVNPNSRLSGNIDVFGNISALQYNGNINLTRTGIRILYLNTIYTIDGQLDVNFDNYNVNILPATLNSARSGGKGILKGKITHNNFADMDMDIDLDVKNFQILNTLPTDSSYFYGTAYATGNINIIGSPEDLKIDVNLKTDKNTNFFIPLESGESLTDDNKFIKFTSDSIINPFVISEKQNYEADLSGMSLNINLDVTPEASIQMIMDQSTGDIIKAKGRGSMKIYVDTRDDFSIFGDFNIVEGDYLFTLRSVISKHFMIGNGGKISWNGDPYNADISLNAVYLLKKVNIYNLLLEDQYRGIKTEVKCDIEMSGKLMNPNIKFNVLLPDAEESVLQKISGLGQEDINKQFLSLLIIGGFQPLPGLSQETVTATPVNTGEILTNQLNRWLSDISDEFDVGLNYQAGDRLSGDELELALSTQLWDDRITINGNVGVGGKTKDETYTNTSNFVGEVEAEIKLNKQGSLRMKVFNKANDDIINDKGPYTQGIGFFWRREFNFLNFWKNRNIAEPDTVK